MKMFRKIITLLIFIPILTTVCIGIDGLIDNTQKSDVIVVLGNKVELSGEPSLRLKSRLDKSIELYKKGIAPRILVSGGYGKEGFDEATVMKEYLVSHSIPEEHVFIDHDGIDSFNTAQNTNKFVEDNSLQSVLIVSNYYHISRTRLAFKRSGIELVYSAHARYFEIRDFYSIIREVVGYYYYLFRKY